MKLLIFLILIILNNSLINGSQLFANFEGVFEENSCTTASANGSGFSLVIGKCVSVFGFLQYYTPFPTTTNWFLTLSDDQKTLEMKQFDADDNTCKGAPINTVTYTQPGCIETPPILLANNSLLSGFNEFTKLSFGTNKPIYANNSIIFSFYDSGNTVNCNWDNLVFSIAYTSGGVIYESDKVTLSLECNFVSQPMSIKCPPQSNNNDKCQTNFIDTVCQSSGDISIYCS